MRLRRLTVAVALALAYVAGLSSVAAAADVAAAALDLGLESLTRAGSSCSRERPFFTCPMLRSQLVYRQEAPPAEAGRR